jgi:hypothetical protein
VKPTSSKESDKNISLNNSTTWWCIALLKNKSVAMEILLSKTKYYIRLDGIDSSFRGAKMSNSYEQQSKVILERINQAEKNAKIFAESVASVKRKESK